MDLSHRDRSEGWTHAKLSGHSNEAAILALLQNDANYREQFLYRLGKSSCQITDLRIGGLHETDVPSIISDGRLTKSKTDLWVRFDDGTTKNISIKKSAGGQVFLIKTERFIEGFQTHYQVQIPERVKCAMMLFWGAKENMSEYIQNFGDCDPRIHAYEVRKNRLVKASLARYDQSLPQELLRWFRQNIGLLADFCFDCCCIYLATSLLPAPALSFLFSKSESFSLYPQTQKNDFLSPSPRISSFLWHSGQRAFVITEMLLR